jgi:hypothetical protein
VTPGPIPPGPLVPTAWLLLAWIMGGLALAWALSGCSPEDRQRLRLVASEVGAKDAGMAACALAHGFDGQIPEAEAVTRWCSKAAFAEPWAELAMQAKAIVDAQRAGKPRPDPVTP